MDYINFSNEFPVIIQLALDWSINFLAAVITLIVGIWFSSRISVWIKDTLVKVDKLDPTLPPVAGSVIRYALLVVTIVAVLAQFGVNTTSIIAVLGAAGLAIGLALQGTLSNVAAGVMLLFLRPFKVGNWIEAANVSGTVREIGLFTTTIDTFDNVYISIPNSTIWSSTIINHSRYNTRRMDIDIGVSYDANIDFVLKTLLTLADDMRVLKKPSPQGLVVSYGDSSIIVRLRLYAKNNVYWGLYWDLMKKTKSVLDEAKIEIPFPQRVVTLLDKKNKFSKIDISGAKKN